jgi:hypothetical protein
MKTRLAEYGHRVKSHARLLDMSRTKTNVLSSGQDDLLIPEEVGPMIRRPLGTLRQWRHRGVGPRSFRLAGKVVYRRSDVEAWIAEQEQATAAGGTPAA